ncbi:hypothetical protein [Succinimonas amylolytica]|uniref:hypothetical protein n=1 Tax=Succinimonas amylolytica TaxID=83769 RepID=UPI0012F93C33|nr:hypothetical protein [Succinimonas amylolytica]
MPFSLVIMYASGAKSPAGIHFAAASSSGSRPEQEGGGFREAASQFPLIPASQVSGITIAGRSGALPESDFEILTGFLEKRGISAS